MAVCQLQQVSETGASRAHHAPAHATILRKQPLQPVQVSLETLSSQDTCNDAIEQAFGREGLGLIVVKGVQGFPEKRRRLLPLASQVQALPAEVKQGLESPATHYSYGYSIGHEVLEDGQPDNQKASYYANPMKDSGSTDPELRRRHPSYAGDNVWPTESLPELQPAFLDLGRLMVETGQLLASHLDRYVESRGLRPRRQLADIIQHSPCHKGRLLHYLPPQPGQASKPRWCGMHTDHGSLTGLASAMFLRGSEEVACPDPEAGLWVRNRGGQFQNVSIPPDALAFQLGEASQVLSGGLLQATPHFVQGAQGPQAHGIARNTFAVFMQPRWDEVMDVPDGAERDQVGIGQWSPDITFGDFTDRTLQKYHPALPQADHVAQIV